ncbi:MAG: zf-TFIIB domain-containing protein [Planctomycetota bacterium]
MCASKRERQRRDVDTLETTLCPSCGNTVYGSEPCPICTSSGAPRRRRDRDRERTTLCAGCGNEIPAGEDCSICSSGRGGKRKPQPKGDVMCPNCEIPIESQNWDGVEVDMCMSCQSMLFPPGALEKVLSKLREAAGQMDITEVLREFRDRHKQQRVPKDVRYRRCPVCGEYMTRRNYAGTSGVILDYCGKHGYWVDQHQFDELSNWVTRGGDQLAARKR